MLEVVDRIAAALAALGRRWPRELILRESGEPVVLLHIADGPEGRSCLVERAASGATLLVPPEALGSRPVLVPQVVLVYLVLVLAASVATISLAAGR